MFRNAVASRGALVVCPASAAAGTASAATQPEGAEGLALRVTRVEKHDSGPVSRGWGRMRAAERCTSVPLIGKRALHRCSVNRAWASRISVLPSGWR